MKSFHNRSPSVAWSLCTAAILCVAAGAFAQSIHKEVDRDGHVTFTDRTGPASLPQLAAVQGSDVAKALAKRAPMNAKDAATVDANEATRRLARARQNRADATGTRAGESTDSAVARKLNEYYLKDRKKEDREIAAAQKRSDKTSSDRSDLLRSDDRTDPHDAEKSR